MIIFKFFLLWLAIGGGIAGILFAWRHITKNQVVGTTKLIVAGVLAFIIAMTIFIMET